MNAVKIYLAVVATAVFVVAARAIIAPADCVPGDSRTARIGGVLVIGGCTHGAESNGK